MSKNSITLRFSLSKCTKKQRDIYNSNEDFKLLGVTYQKTEQNISLPSEDVTIYAREQTPDWKDLL